MRLTDFDTARFLRDAWQKAPLLIPNPWAAWSNPLAPDELAGLACEPGIQSRLVSGSGSGWQVEHGPLPETRFSELGDIRWTLLVQSVDHHVPAVAALLEPFRFLPNWRIDDVMVSYAVDAGGVGPHFDHYDVFLIQGLGSRRWQVGPSCDDAAPLLPHDDLRLLAEFTPTQEWLLGPGDILYLPPGFAHNGIAVGEECMTYSVGFRAPSRGELIAGWAEHAATAPTDDDRYRDPPFARLDNPGEITSEALDRLHAMVAERLLDRRAFASWFGEFTTAPKHPEIDWRPEDPPVLAELQAGIAAGTPLLRNPASRFAFVRNSAGSLTLFVDGTAHDCFGPTAELAEHLCAAATLNVDRDVLESRESLELLFGLVRQGSVALDSDT